MLLFDAAEALKEASLIMTRHDAATPAAVEIAMLVIRMVQDALDLTAICPAMRSRDCFRNTKTGASATPLMPLTERSRCDQIVRLAPGDNADEFIRTIQSLFLLSPARSRGRSTC